MKSTQILLVEDDKLLLQMYSQKLEREGIHIHCETNGKEAAEWLKTNTPSLVVLDILLPGINGLQLIKIIRRQEHLQNTRIIILTNLTEADTHLSEELRSSLNIAAYYVKSQIGPRELVKNLKALLQ